MMKLEVAYGILYRYIIRYEQLLMSPADFSVFKFICDRTLSFHKFTERILPNHFKGMCSPSLFMIALPQSKRRIKNIKADLKQRYFFFRNRHVYTVNVRGIIKVFVDYLPLHLNEKEIEAFRLLYQAFDKKHPKLLKKEIQPVARVVRTIEEQTKQGLGRSEKAKEKTKDKLLKLPRQELSPKKLRYLFEALVGEYYEDYEYTEVWTGKIVGHARNWLKYVQGRRQKPQEILREVVANWSSIAIQDEWGNPIHLSLYPKFQEYFEKREKIHDWLASHRDDDNEDEIKESPNIKRIKL